MRILKRKVLKLGVSEECLWKLVAIQEQMGTNTLTETVMRLVNERHPESPTRANHQ